VTARDTGPEISADAEGNERARTKLGTGTTGAYRGKGGLGRGLGALIPAAAAVAAGSEAPAELFSPRSDVTAVPAQASAIPVADVPRAAGPLTVDIDLIAPNPRQPRTTFAPELLESLAGSIRQHGLLHPLVVRRNRTPGGMSYELIAGERRLHAARRAGLERVPVVIRDVTPVEQLELALVENIQRADLNPLEEALAFQSLISEFGLTQEALAQRVGRGRVAVANTLRLLTLSNEIQASLIAGAITEGHARALLGLAGEVERQQVWQQVVERGLSVRETEALVRAIRDAVQLAVGTKASMPPRARRQDPEIVDLAARLQTALGTAVRIDRGKRGGKLVLHFYSDEELDALCTRLLSDEQGC